LETISTTPIDPAALADPAQSVASMLKR